jgi:hypothetical protein
MKTTRRLLRSLVNSSTTIPHIGTSKSHYVYYRIRALLLHLARLKESALKIAGYVARTTSLSNTFQRLILGILFKAFYNMVLCVPTVDDRFLHTFQSIIASDHAETMSGLLFRPLISTEQPYATLKIIEDSLGSETSQ